MRKRPQPFLWGGVRTEGYVHTPKQRPACVLAGPSPLAGRHGASPAKAGNTAGGIVQHPPYPESRHSRMLALLQDGNREDGPS